MKVLFICNKSPYPPNEGGSLGMYVFIKGIADAGHQVKVLALNTNKSYIDPANVPEDFRKQTRIEFIDKDLRVKPVAAFLNLFSSRSFHVERFISGKFEDKLTEVLKNEVFDIVQVEYLYMAPYLKLIRKYSKAKVILRSHNIEHMIWGRITSITRNPMKKAYLNLLSKRLKNYELSVINDFDGMTTVSKIDAGYFRNSGCRIPVSDIPFGIDIDKYHKGENSFEFPSLFHLGAMNWIPNLEGIKWFLDHAWPLIHKKFPGLKFYLAGRLMPEWLLKIRLPNVEVLGEVPDATAFINSKAVMIVPLFSGSGIRVKIIEGMALGKAVISTAIGAEGIEYTNGENIMIANDPPEFLEAIERCINNRGFTERLGTNARKLIEDQHSLRTIIQKLVTFYASVTEN